MTKQTKLMKKRGRRIFCIQTASLHSQDAPHFLCGQHHRYATVLPPSRIIIHLFPDTRGAFTEGTRRAASIKELAMCIWKTQLPRKAHKNNKKKIPG